jgi:DNA-binding NarL/FixJ family response regulator
VRTVAQPAHGPFAAVASRDSSAAGYADTVPSLVIVGDHEGLREGLAALLAKLGVEVIRAAGSAAEGLDLVGRIGPDVVLVDTHLPDGSGIDLTRVLLERRPELGVIRYTGDRDADTLYAGLDSGARGHALKAGAMPALVGAIARIAAGGSYVDPRLDGILVSPRAAARVPQLSPREREIMDPMAEGPTAEAIARRPEVSGERVRTHIRNVIGKLRRRKR